MKKLILILIIGAMSSSCGSDSIDIAKIDTPCRCAEEAVKIFKKILPYKSEIKTIRKEAAIKDGKGPRGYDMYLPLRHATRYDVYLRRR